MYPTLRSFLVQTMITGEDVLIGAPRHAMLDAARKEIKNTLEAYGLKYSSTSSGGFELAMAGTVTPIVSRMTFVALDRVYGVAGLHAPVLVVLASKSCHAQALEEFRQMKTSFKTLHDPIVMAVDL